MFMISLRTACARTARTTRHVVRGLLAGSSWKRRLRALSSSRGQGTVEYVGIVIVIGVLLVALKAGMGDQGGTIAHKISKSVSDAIQGVIEGKSAKG
jgi:hypothetical protein